MMMQMAGSKRLRTSNFKYKGVTTRMVQDFEALESVKFFTGAHEQYEKECASKWLDKRLATQRSTSSKSICSGTLQKHFPHRKHRLEHGSRVWSSKVATALWKQYAREHQEVLAQLKHFEEPQFNVRGK